MRVLCLTIVLAGCGLDSNCTSRGKSTMTSMMNVAPGTMLSVLLSACSTCAHSQAEAQWPTAKLGASVTGTVDVKLSPGCFVQDTTQMLGPLLGDGTADANWKNCGDTLTVNAYVTNNLSVTLDSLKLTLYCPTAM
jgi:hypothetical protein